MVRDMRWLLLVALVWALLGVGAAFKAYDVGHARGYTQGWFDNYALMATVELARLQITWDQSRRGDEALRIWLASLVEESVGQIEWALPHVGEDIEARVTRSVAHAEGLQAELCAPRTDEVTDEPAAEAAARP